MALVKPVIFQVVGYQNSGKTTVMTALIKRLKEDGLNVVTIKHHGHGGKPEVVQNKDSAKHSDFGAGASVVEGGGRLLLQAEKPVWTLKEEIQLISFFAPDIILVEGHKSEPFPKLLLVRNQNDMELIKAAGNIQIIIFWEETPKNLQIECPSFHIQDLHYLDWVADYLKSQLGNH